MPWHEQFLSLPLPGPEVTLAGKTVIVIGASRGLGLEVALHLARLGPEKMIIGCRQVKKGIEAAEYIKSKTSCKSLEAWPIDLESFQSVKDFATRFHSEGLKELHILVECAAILTMQFARTGDGWEKNLQVNHLSTSLLALLLLPNLVLASTPKHPSRLVIVTSDSISSVTKLPEADVVDSTMFEKLNDESHSKKFGAMMLRYPLTKLFNVYLARQINRRLGPEPAVTAVSCHPGFCKTDLLREWDSYPVINLFVWLFMYLFARTAEKGSRALLYGAVSGRDEEIRGQYLTSCRIGKTVGYQSRAAEDRIWNETVEILTEFDPSVQKVVDQYLQN